MKYILPTALVCSVAAATSSLYADFQFTGPQVMELSSKTQSMVTTDLDNDGRKDLLIANNQDMKLECLYQRTSKELEKESKASIDNSYIQPVYSDLPFLRKQVLLGEYVYSMNTLDFDGDGMTDIVYTGKTNKLVVLFQTTKGKWDKSWNHDEEELLEYADTLSTADINKDGKDDLAVLFKGSIQIYFNNSSRDRPTPVSYAVSVDDAQNLKLTDVNNDGLLDLVYFSKFHPYAMRFRLQQVGGRFGAEIAVPVKTGSTDWLVYNKPGKPIEFATINKNQAEINIQTISENTSDKLGEKFIQAHMFHVPTAGKISSVYTTGDFNGDGRMDVVAADPNGASLYYYMKSEHGSYLPPKQYATYSGVTSINSLRVKGEKSDSLLVCSGKEHIVGIAKYEEKAFGFPKNLEMSGELLLSTAVDVDGDDNDEVVVLEQTGRRYKMHVLSQSDSDLDFEIPLGSINREPTHFITKDLNNDGVKDVALIVPRDSMRVFLKDDSNKLTEFKDESGLLKGQFLDILPSQFNVFDHDGDGKKEWILAKPGFIRYYHIEGDKLTISAQCNAREEGDVIRGPILLKTSKDAEASIYAYDEKSLSMQVFEKQDDGVFRYNHMSSVGRIDLQYAEVSEGDDAAALVFGRHSFWYIPLKNQVYSNKIVQSLTTNVKKARFQKIALADLNQDKVDEIIAIDGVDGFLEIFGSTGEKGKWQSAMNFKIFEDVSGGRKDPATSRFDPREIVTADFNNDGKNDIALLCHNKILVYTQK